MHVKQLILWHIIMAQYTFTITIIIYEDSFSTSDTNTL